MHSPDVKIFQLFKLARFGCQLTVSFDIKVDLRVVAAAKFYISTAKTNSTKWLVNAYAHSPIFTAPKL